MNGGCHGTSDEDRVERDSIATIERCSRSRPTARPGPFGQSTSTVTSSEAGQAPVRRPRIAVDATGGDFAPRNIVDGALVAARHLELGVILVGASELLRDELRRHDDADRLDVTVVDAPDTIGMHESPAAALRRKPRAAVRVAAGIVAKGEAVALFSAGNTGATMLAAHRAFGRLAGVDRPALATTIPTAGRGAVLLDSGANVDCRRGTCCSLRPWAPRMRGSCSAWRSRRWGCCRLARKKPRAMS